MYRIHGFFVVALLCSAVLWSMNTTMVYATTLPDLSAQPQITSVIHDAMATSNPVPTTWGAVKAMYDISDQTTKDTSPGTNSIGSSMGIAWPFVGQSPDLWVGDEGSRYGGVDGSYCGGTRNNTHSGADYYARDLSRNDGKTEGQPIGAGIAGKAVVVTFSDKSYGNTVVIYDSARRIAVRYAHLKSIAVVYGQYVPLRQNIGTVGKTGNITGPHLHLAVYVNIDHFQRNGDPCIPTLCDNDYYACAVYFFS